MKLNNKMLLLSVSGLLTFGLYALPATAQEAGKNMPNGAPNQVMDNRAPCPCMQKRMQMQMQMQEKMEDKSMPKVDFQEAFAAKLQLTDEQKLKADEIHKKGIDNLKPIYDEIKDLRKKADELRAENMQEFDAILTDEQRQILKQMQNRKPNGFAKSKSPKGPKEFAPKKGKRQGKPVNEESNTPIEQ